MRSLLPALVIFSLSACNGDAGFGAPDDAERLVDARALLADAADDDDDDEAPSFAADDDDAERDDDDDDDLDAGSPRAAKIRDDNFEFKPQTCVHTVDERRPRITNESQERTKRVLRHLTKRMGVHEDFRKLLALIALRESSYQAGLVHRLSPDLNASYVSWRKMSDRYENNPYADDPALWQTYGLFGMNSNYFTLLWDKESDPRVLCDPIVDILLYRRAALRALRKINSGAIRCKGADGESFVITLDPTWYNIHRAVSGGKICPSKHEDRAATMRKYFVSRATRSGINPDALVTTKMLGKEPNEGVDGEPWDDQEQMVMGLWAEIEAEVAAEAAKAAARETAKAERKAQRLRAAAERDSE